MSAVKDWASRVAGLAGLVVVLVSCGGGDLKVDVTGPSKSTRADGKTAADISVTVTRGGKAIADTANGQVKFSTDKGSFEAFDASITPDQADANSTQTVQQPLSSGAAKVKLYSLTSGAANVTVSYSDDNGGAATKTLVVNFGSNGNGNIASIQYVGADPATINLQGSGGITTTQVTFKALDSSGSPVADGVTVSFALSQNPGGASIAPPTATTSNGTGTVQTVLSAGSVPGTVVIVATAGTISAQSQPIAIAGGGVNFKNFSLACDNYSIAGFAFFGLTNNCTVFASDVHGQFVSGTQIQIMTEAGGVPQTLQVAPAADGSNKGTATFPYQTQCPIPVDVTPNPATATSPAEYSKHILSTDPEAFVNPCHLNGAGQPAAAPETRTVNPRDGYATLVAFTLGEECYTDRNANGKYDPGEDDNLHCDLGEPFLDENDNGQWDGPGVDPTIPEGEPFFDYDSNGTWTPPNGHYDAQWPIWRSVTMTWTGAPDPVLTHVVPSNPFPTILPHCGSADFEIQFADVNGNCPTAASADDALNLDCGQSNCLVPTQLYPKPIQGCSSATINSAGLPQFPGQVTDAHDCACDPVVDNNGNPINFPDAGPANPCSGTNFSVSAVFSRTLASDVSGAIGGTGTENDSLSPVVTGAFR